MICFTVLDNGHDADIVIETDTVGVTIEVRKRQVLLRAGMVDRFCVQPRGADEPWSRHIDPEAALLAGIRRARRIEKAWTPKGAKR